jgi:hypothetical protein
MTRAETITKCGAEPSNGEGHKNPAGPVAIAAELTPENMELLASYSRPGDRAAAIRPEVTSGTYL